LKKHNKVPDLADYKTNLLVKPHFSQTIQFLKKNAGKPYQVKLSDRISGISRTKFYSNQR
jgi:hypothetical protein